VVGEKPYADSLAIVRICASMQKMSPWWIVEKSGLPVLVVVVPGGRS